MAARVHEIYSAQSSNKNHRSALTQPNIIDSFLKKECSLGATCGPFQVNPLRLSLVLSSLQIASSRQENHALSSTLVTCLSCPSTVAYQKTPTSTSHYLQAIICDKGPGCHLFKKDLSCAYRRLRVDPHNYNYLGYHHNGLLYFDIAPPFSLRFIVFSLRGMLSCRQLC